CCAVGQPGARVPCLTGRPSESLARGLACFLFRHSLSAAAPIKHRGHKGIRTSAAGAARSRSRGSVRTTAKRQTHIVGGSISSCRSDRILRTYPSVFLTAQYFDQHIRNADVCAVALAWSTTTAGARYGRANSTIAAPSLLVSGQEAR